MQATSESRAHSSCSVCRAGPLRSMPPPTCRSPQHPAVTSAARTCCIVRAARLGLQWQALCNTRTSTQPLPPWSLRCAASPNGSSACPCLAARTSVARTRFDGGHVRLPQLVLLLQAPVCLHLQTRGLSAVANSGDMTGRCCNHALLRRQAGIPGAGQAPPVPHARAAQDASLSFCLSYMPCRAEHKRRCLNDACYGLPI